MYVSPWPPLEIPKCNILSYLFPPNAKLTHKPIWIDANNPSSSLSQVQMLSLIKRFAVGLDKLGIPEQQAIMIFSPNHIFVPVVYLTAAGSKRFFTGANPGYTTSELAHQIKAVDAAVLLIHDTLLETGIAAAKEASMSLDRMFVFSESETSGFQDWRSILASEAEAESWQWDPLGEAAIQTVAVINFSSGTTGLPKGVCISHHNLIANTAQVVNQGAYTSAEIWLAFLPLYHAYSQLFTMNIACRLQIPVYIMFKFTFEGLLRHIQQFKITALQAVPPILIMMAKRPETAKYDISSIKHIISGAAPLSSDLQNEVMNQFGMIVNQAFGMSETTCAAFMNRGLSRDVTGSIGYLLPNTEAFLLNETGAEPDEGEPGELYLRGPQIMLEYWRNEQATLESTTDGWLKTGDVAITRNGRWWIVDRKKELIKVNGLQVAPAELEAVLLEHQDVADSAVAGITVHNEELPRGYVVLRADARTTAKELQDFVAQRVAKHKRLTGGIKFIQEVPKVASGKIVRKIVKEWAKADAKDMEHTIKGRL